MKAAIYNQVHALTITIRRIIEDVFASLVVTSLFFVAGDVGELLFHVHQKNLFSFPPASSGYNFRFLAQPPNYFFWIVHLGRQSDTTNR